MSDETPRPRPQYGEYATPEEQRARIRQPDIDAALEAGTGGAAVAASPAVVVPRAGVPAAPAVAAAPVSRGRTVDRVVTFALLTYGLVNVVTAIPALVDFAAYADTVFQLLGVDVELSDPAAGRPWGIAAALVLGIGWLITAAVSWWSMRRGRLTWWIPLVGGLVFSVASSVLVFIPLMADQAAWDALVGSLR